VSCAPGQSRRWAEWSSGGYGGSLLRVPVHRIVEAGREFGRTLSSSGDKLASREQRDWGKPSGRIGNQRRGRLTFEVGADGPADPLKGRAFVQGAGGHDRPESLAILSATGTARALGTELDHLEGLGHQLDLLDRPLVLGSLGRADPVGRIDRTSLQLNNHEARCGTWIQGKIKKRSLLTSHGSRASRWGPTNR
jgi:hypothetical protein